MDRAVSERLQRVLVAGRGPVALRLVQGLRRTGVETVAAWSDADAEAPYVEQADFDAWLGAGEALAVWRDAARLVAAAMDAGCDALHLGAGPAAAELDVVAAATAANLAVIGVEPNKAAELLDQQRVLGRARRIGLFVPPWEAVADGEDGIAAAARVGMPLVAASAAGGYRERIDGFDGLTGAVERVRAAGAGPCLFLHAGAGTDVEVVVVRERAGRTMSLGPLVSRGPAVELAPGAGSVALAPARAWAEDVGFVGVGVARFRVLEDTPWFVGFGPHLPEALGVVEAVYGIDLAEAQLQLTASGSCPWAGGPLAGRCGVWVPIATGPGQLVGLGDDASAARAAARDQLARSLGGTIPADLAAALADD